MKNANQKAVLTAQDIAERWEAAAQLGWSGVQQARDGFGAIYHGISF